MTLMTISLGLLAGLITDQLLTPGFRFWYLTLTLSALLFFLAKKEARFYALDHPLKKIMIAGCVAACFALGGIRSELERETRVRTVPFADRDGKESVCVEAVVIAPAVETKTRLSVTVRMIADCAERADRPKPSAKAILILPPETAAPVYGNRLRIAGVPSAIPEKSRSAYFNDLRRNDITHIFHKPDGPAWVLRRSVSGLDLSAQGVFQRAHIRALPAAGERADRRNIDRGRIENPGRN